MKSGNDYIVQGYKTILQKVDEKNNKVRIMALVNNTITEDIVIMNKEMTANFPSIWMEYNTPRDNKIIIGGFYREWTHNGVKSVEEHG